MFLQLTERRIEVIKNETTKPNRKLTSSFKLYDESNREYIINEFTIYNVVGGKTTGTHIVPEKEYETSDGKKVLLENNNYKIVAEHSFIDLVPSKT
jgi:hypothetical protein